MGHRLGAIRRHRLAQGKNSHPEKTRFHRDCTAGNHPITGLADLQKYLLTERRDQFAHALVSKMLIYALGRDLELKDQPLVEELSKSFAKNEYRLPGLMANIARSQPFLSR